MSPVVAPSRAGSLPQGGGRISTVGAGLLAKRSGQTPKILGQQQKSPRTITCPRAFSCCAKPDYFFRP
ncbi:hypothetical protein EAH74_09595 [Pseudomonas mandelii]|uniref:Uncharacterized protein n=1 Tax=Pseudomonas mandelii TaxID=75612 RepID=A0A502IIE3_9PSED|nr:hypothetical protein EAH74_09595 [Pseudomonas mandelii]